MKLCLNRANQTLLFEIKINHVINFYLTINAVKD